MHTIKSSHIPGESHELCANIWLSMSAPIFLIRIKKASTRHLNLMRPLPSRYIFNSKELRGQFCRSLIFAVFNEKICLLFCSNDDLNYKVLINFCTGVWGSSFRCHLWQLEQKHFGRSQETILDCPTFARDALLPFPICCNFNWVVQLLPNLCPSMVKSIYFPLLSHVKKKWLHPVRFHAWQNKLCKFYKQFEYFERSIGFLTSQNSHQTGHCILMIFALYWHFIRNMYTSCLPVFGNRAWHRRKMSVFMGVVLQPSSRNLVKSLKSQPGYIQNTSI